MPSVRLGWGVWLAAGGLYVACHHAVLLARPGGSFDPAWPMLSWPPGALAPLAVALAAVAAGLLIASRLGGAPRAVRAVVGGLSALAVAAHLVETFGWLVGGATFRFWTWAAMTLALGFVARLFPPARVADPLPPAASSRDVLRRWLVVLALVIGALHAYALGRTVHVGARAWDGESYHLPVPLQWLHLESLTAALERQAVFGIWGIEKFGNPGNGHLLFLLPLAVGWDLLAFVLQLLFVPLAGWAVHRLARQAGASAPAASLAAAAFVSMPIVAEQAAVPMLDLATASLSLAALAVLVSAAEAPEPPGLASLATAGLALGFALGTKTTALSHSLLIAAAVLSSAWWRGPWRRGLVAVAAVGVSIVIPSVFWYARSARVFGNPIYPLELRVLGVTLAEGTTAEDMSGRWDLDRMKMASRWEWLTFPFRDPEYFNESGFGALFVATAALGLAGSLVVLSRREKGPSGRLAILVMVGLVCFWFVGARTPRFNLPVFALMAAAAAPALDRMAQARGRHVVGASAVVLAAVTLQVSLFQHGWGLGPPQDRRTDLEQDWPGIPAGIDVLSPSVIFNDSTAHPGGEICNYKLSGADHRHLVFDHRGLPSDDPHEFLRRLEQLGADLVFLKVARGKPDPVRYATPALVPLLRFEGKEVRSTVFRVDRSGRASPASGSSGRPGPS